MLRFSANISTLFTEFPWFERIRQACLAGFDGIEIQFPYELDAAELKAALDDSGLPLVLMNFPAGDLMAGGQGLAGIPGREAGFRQALELAREYAQVLRPQKMNLLSGRPQAGLDRAQCLQLFEDNLIAAHGLLQPLGIGLLTEAVNTLDWPGFLVSNTRQGIELIERLGLPGLRLQFDIYHSARMGENPLHELETHLDQIGHIQFSDCPGRGQPGSGALDFDALFQTMDDLPYAGFIGAEYFPTVATRDSLSWLK